MAQNTGKEFEDKVFGVVDKLVKANEFMVSEPYVKVRRKARYYSKDRETNIECEISVEKYLADPDTNTELRPAIIVIIECKDYAGAIPVDDVEEFHAKLQQIGADNTKGIMITQNGHFQKSALTYALSKGIALARILPDDQVRYVMYDLVGINLNYMFDKKRKLTAGVRALTESKYCSEDGESFFALTGESDMRELLHSLLNENRR